MNKKIKVLRIKTIANTHLVLRNTSGRRLADVFAPAGTVVVANAKGVYIEVNPQSLLLDQICEIMNLAARQMTPEEKAEVRKNLDQEFGLKLPLTETDRTLLREAGIKP